MKHTSKSILTMVVIGLLACLLALSIYCSKQEEVKHDEGSEESGTQFTLDEKYDMIRNGAHLNLGYDKASNSFVGSVKNTTDKTLEKVRVEVHLSNGTELGPTTPTDLKPGEKMDIKLTATSEKFEKWGAHPEVGSGEHSHGEGGEHSHGEVGEHGHGEGGEHSHGEGSEHKEGSGEHK
jgi:hypothetical protein